MRVWIGALLAVILAAGCGGLPREPQPIAADVAATATSDALGLELKKAPDPDSPVLSNLMATYAGSDHHRNALLLVFDSPLATRQFLGKGTEPPGAKTARVRNIVLLYRGSDASSQLAGAERALARVAPR